MSLACLTSAASHSLSPGSSAFRSTQGPAGFRPGPGPTPVSIPGTALACMLATPLCAPQTPARSLVDPARGHAALATLPRLPGRPSECPRPAGPGTSGSTGSASGGGPARPPATRQCRQSALRQTAGMSLPSQVSTHPWRGQAAKPQTLEANQ